MKGSTNTLPRALLPILYAEISSQIPEIKRV